jgi:hypothetical protein
MITANDTNPIATVAASAQFGLRSLLEFVTWCGVLSAFTPISGVAAGVCLMLLALALWSRQGGVALAMLMAACLAAELPSSEPSSGSAFGRQFVTILAAAALCGWYQMRRNGT